MSQRLSYTVHGDVQGVNFRSFATKKATGYGITGWVSNTSDGKVHGEAQGDEASIQKFIDDLGRGPSAAHVVKVEKSEVAVKEGEESFVTK